MIPSRSLARHSPHEPLDPGLNSRQNLDRQPTSAREQNLKPPKHMSEGQRSYEARRAAKAGLSMEKWLAAKERDRLAEEKAKAKAVEATKPAKPPGFFRRLLERAQKPLGS
jgi:hypothetical protein